MTDSILDSTKKVLGIEADYYAFDVDILMHINSAFSTLFQLGVGPTDHAFQVDDKETKWEDFLGDNKDINQVKTYIFIKTKLVFDPPANSFAVTSMEKMATEAEWRLNVIAEGGTSEPAE